MNRIHTKVHIKKKSRFYGTFLEFLLSVNNVLLLKSLAAPKEIVVKIKGSVVDHHLLQLRDKDKTKSHCNPRTFRHNRIKKLELMLVRGSSRGMRSV